MKILLENNKRKKKSRPLFDISLFVFSLILSFSLVRVLFSLATMNALAATSRGSLSLRASEACSSSGSCSNAARASSIPSPPTTPPRRTRPRSIISASSVVPLRASFHSLPPRAMPQRLGAYATGGVDKVRGVERGRKESFRMHLKISRQRSLSPR